MSATCFLIEPTTRRRVWLRRLHLGAHVHECSVYGYHDARTLVGDFDLDADLPPPEEFPADRWPTACACGYRFGDGDLRQVFDLLLYRRADGTGDSFTLQDRTPGMMWFAPWYWNPAKENYRRRGGPFLSEHFWRDHADRRPPLVVVCPNGQEWCPDRPSTNGTGWTVTGEAPRITCAPSIVVPGYHGFLRDGVFTADIEGRGPSGAPA